MEENPRGVFAEYERLYLGFQRLLFSMFYPYLLALLAAALGFSFPTLNRSMGLGLGAALSSYFEKNPLGGNALYGQLIVLGVTLLIGLLVFFFLFKPTYAKSAKMEKAKYLICLAIIVYILDTIVLLLSVIPSLPWSFFDWTYFVNLGIHALFVALLFVLLAKYGKITRFQEEHSAK